MLWRGTCCAAVLLSVVGAELWDQLLLGLCSLADALLGIFCIAHIPLGSAWSRHEQALCCCCRYLAQPSS